MEIFGYEFADETLLHEALVTPSYKMERPDARDNQRLEFLGDAVLGLLAADVLFAADSKGEEGPLTVRRTRMVSSAALCEAAARLNLVPRLIRNRNAAPLPPDSKTIADAVEAIIGAAWLDGGLPAAKRIFEALGLSAAEERAGWRANPRGDLQIRAQAMHPPRLPVYRRLSVGGTAHSPVFTVSVSVEGLGEATGKARSMKEAETKAAAALLASLAE